jgi:hypothetical protein
MQTINNSQNSENHVNIATSGGKRLLCCQNARCQATSGGKMFSFGMGSKLSQF